MKVLKYYLECMTSLKDLFTGKATKARLKEYLRGVFIYIQYIALFIYSYYITRSWSDAVIMLLVVTAIVCIQFLLFVLSDLISSKRKRKLDETEQVMQIYDDTTNDNDVDI